MICGNCGTQNDTGAKFCQECAAPLAATCPNCGATPKPGARFCSQCATPLDGVASLPGADTQPRASEPQPAVAERRLVSVLFADLVGFTPFAEERDPEEVRDTLSRYFDLARETIERYGGTVEKFIGDAVMAVWGAPVAHEDDAERAVRAALELVDAVPSLGSTIQARAGVLTGEAAVTIGATNQGMVAGDIVNTASRLQAAAGPGSVLVGESTQLATSRSIAYAPAGEQVLKGKQTPVAAWRAVRVVAERRGRNRSEALEAPFVGRQEEMRLLKDLLLTTTRERRVRIVSVIGPGGIGKSRVAWELSKYVDGLAEPYYWHSGRSPAYGEGVTFWALGEMVRQRCDLAEGDDEHTTLTKVSATVAEYITDPEEREWVERSLLTLLGVEASLEAEQLFGAWRTFFERIAEQGTVVLVFEDVHFADSGTLDFIDHVLEWSRGLPLYLVTLARPELLERRPNWGAAKRSFVSLELDPLSEDDMRLLLAGLVPGLPAPAVATIVARADGIPLYAVETVRALVGEGRLVERDGVFVASGDLTKLSVPSSLTALIASRLDMLDETDRRLIHDAAVLGQSFSVSALSAVAGLPVSDLEPRLAGLVRRELLERQADARSPERGQYTFIQALIREVAYNTLSRKERKKLHLSAARYFESLGSDEIAGALASHYLAAHADAGDAQEAAALAGQARLALKAAATRASALGSFSQAADFLGQALTITNDPPERVQLLLQAGTARMTAGRLEPAEDETRQAMDLSREIGDRESLAEAIARLGRILTYLFRPQDAIALLEPALVELADVDEIRRLELKTSLVAALRATGDRPRALALIDDVLSRAELLGVPELIARGLGHRAHLIYGMGRRREAWGVIGAAKDLAAEYGITNLVLESGNALMGGTGEIDLKAAMAMGRDLIELARRTGQRSQLILVVSGFGYMAFLGGEWDEAQAEMEPLLDEDMSLSHRLWMLNNVLIIHAVRGESISDGLEEMERLSEAMVGTGSTLVDDPAGNAALAHGDYATARRHWLHIAETLEGNAPEFLYRAWRPALWSGRRGGRGGAAAALQRERRIWPRHRSARRHHRRRHGGCGGQGGRGPCRLSRGAARLARDRRGLGRGADRS